MCIWYAHGCVFFLPIVHRHTSCENEPLVDLLIIPWQRFVLQQQLSSIYQSIYGDLPRVALFAVLQVQPSLGNKRWIL
jgi:hypothetical protein